MPSELMDDFLNQAAVYWAPTGEDDSGQQGYATPVEIRCRWTEETIEMVGGGGVTKTSSALVLTDRLLAEQGVLWEGTINLLTDLADPFKNPGAFQVQRVRAIPDADGEKTVFKAYL